MNDNFTQKLLCIQLAMYSCLICNFFLENLYVFDNDDLS